MERAKIVAYILLACLCVAISAAVLFSLALFPSMPRNLAASEAFLVSSPTGDGRSYHQGDAVFSAAVEAFLEASRLPSLPPQYEQALFLTVSWQQANGRQADWRLYVSPQPLGGYLVDERGNAYALTEQGALFFATQSFCSPLLVGDPPPALHIDGQAVPVSLCSWTYTVSTQDGGRHQISSGEYTNPSATIQPISLDALFMQFAEQPDDIEFTVYAAADEVLSSTELPSAAQLAPGDYQLVLVCQWQRGEQTVRAAYSFSFSV